MPHEELIYTAMVHKLWEGERRQRRWAGSEMSAPNVSGATQGEGIHRFMVSNIGNF